MPLKELAKYIALCRKQGVTKLKMDGIELELGPEPTKTTQKRPSVELPNFDPGYVPQYAAQLPDDIKTDIPEGDALLFYSADPQPEAN